MEKRTVVYEDFFLMTMILQQKLGRTRLSIKRVRSVDLVPIETLTWAPGKSTN